MTEQPRATLAEWMLPSVFTKAIVAKCDPGLQKETWCFRSVRGRGATSASGESGVAAIQRPPLTTASLHETNQAGGSTAAGDRGVSDNDLGKRGKGRLFTSATGMSPNIYTSHFGLSERPFSLVPDPDFLFWSAEHQRAYSMLEYGIITRAPITLITGEVGTGKTTLLHHLLKMVDENVRIGLVSNAHGSRGELLRWVMMSLDQPVPHEATYVDLFAAFQSYVIAEYAQGNRVILIFDEAQNLSKESLEELRMFTNINSNKDELLQLVLVGQPELRDIIRQPDMSQFAQRVAATFHLTAMDSKTARQYIAHRMQIAEANTNPFSPAAMDLIYNATGGVPRLVNQLCDLALVYAFTKGRKRVMESTIQQVLDDGVFFGPHETGKSEGTL